MQILVLGVVIEEQNFKDEFLELVLKFLEYLSNLIRFKDPNVYISSSKESTGSLWCKLSIEICKICTGYSQLTIYKKQRAK